MLSAEAQPTPDGSPSVGGFDNYTHTVTVYDAFTGEPIPDASVRAYVVLERVTARTQEVGVAIIFFWAETRDEIERVMVHDQLRTDSGGRATFNAPLGVAPTFVVAAPGYTEEFVRTDLPQVDLQLYPKQAVAQITGNWSDIDLEGGSHEWRAFEATWGPGDEIGREANRRIVAVDATMQWTTEPGYESDLGFALGASQDKHVIHENSGDETLDWGDHEESISLGFADLEGYSMLGDDVFFVGPTKESMVAPFGIDYDIEVQGTFDAKRLRDQFCAAEYEPVGETLSVSEAEARVASGEESETLGSQGDGRTGDDLPADKDGTESAPEPEKNNLEKTKETAGVDDVDSPTKGRTGDERNTPGLPVVSVIGALVVGLLAHRIGPKRF